MVTSDLSPDESRETRAQIYAAVDAERRAFERAIHDGVQQDLIAVSVQVQLARRLAESDLGATVALLGEIGAGVREAVDRVRALADRIYPSLLDARGLPDALRAAAAAVGIPTIVEAEGVARYPAHLEASVYFCCREALENLAHAGAGATATVRLVATENTLSFEIDSAAPLREAGLAAVRDRVESLGGELVVESESGLGTRLAATIPLYGESSAR